jgi:hypothetical protein
MPLKILSGTVIITPNSNTDIAREIFIEQFMELTSDLQTLDVLGIINDVCLIEDNEVIARCQTALFMDESRFAESGAGFAAGIVDWAEAQKIKESATLALEMILYDTDEFKPLIQPVLAKAQTGPELAALLEQLASDDGLRL